MPDKYEDEYKGTLLLGNPETGEQLQVDPSGKGYLAKSAPPPVNTLSASLSGSTRPQTAPPEQKPPVTPQVVAKAVAKLKEGGPKRPEKKKNPEDLMKAAQAMHAEILARNAAMAAQPSAVDAALQRDAVRSPQHGTPKTGYELPLDHNDEPKYEQWKQKYAPNDSGGDYDLRGAYKAGLTPGPDGHWLDTFKKPNHPTFSDESVYAEYAPDKAGSWDNDKYVPPKKAKK